ncbi:MAG: [Schwartzia sp.]|nr:[FeFe] hydrogenase H-cluster maturation GTPase HydF [Schwartzia sp. (in: firmicutes)]
KLDDLPADARILIAEACTHNALDADIGRVKIPAMLRKKLGGDIKIEVVGGADFPAELSGYDLIVHCGACMFNRRYVLSRVEAARAAGVPMTNYGILIAKLSGILDKVAFPIGRTRRL